MTRFDVRMAHSAELAHHVVQGKAWLKASDLGENTAAISYAALEFRFAIERLAIHWWRQLLDRPLTEGEMDRVGTSFKAIEKRIYELAGHQQAIDRHYDFMRMVLDTLSITVPLHTPHLSLTSKHWNLCSELCHIGWPLSCSVQRLRHERFLGMSEVARALDENVSSAGWPCIVDAPFDALRRAFLTGHVDADAVRDQLRRLGISATIEPGEERTRQPVRDGPAPAYGTDNA